MLFFRAQTTKAYLEAVGEREDWRVRGRHARHTNGRVPVGLLAQIWKGHHGHSNQKGWGKD